MLNTQAHTGLNTFSKTTLTMILKTWLTTLLLFSFHFLIAQQSYVIRGKVSDQSTGEVLPGATIFLMETEQGISADADGLFVITNIKQQIITIKVSFVGYETLEKKHIFKQKIEETFHFRLKPLATELQQVQVTGQAKGQVKALIQQQLAENIIHVVSAEQINQFPDMNAAEAIKRIPGITLQRDQGEGRFIQLRGTPPELTNFNINGEQIPSPESKVRYVGMDIIAADQIEKIEISKVLTPDMDGDGIGGTVNIVTKKASGETPEITATLASGYSHLRGKPNYQAQFSYSKRYKRFGFQINGSYYQNEYGSDNMEFVFAKGPFWGSTGDSVNNYYLHYREFQLRYYDIKRSRLGMSTTLDYDLSPTTNIYLRGMINSYTDEEIRRRKIYTLNDPISLKYYLYGGIDHDIKSRTKTQQLSTLNLGGTTDLPLLNIDYEISWAYASERIPDRLESRFENPGQAIAIKFDLENPNYPRPYFPDPENSTNATDWANYDMDELLLENQQTNDQNITARLNLKFPYRTKWGNGYFKTGFKMRNKFKTRDVQSMEYGAYRTTSILYPGEGPELSLATISDEFYVNDLFGKDFYELAFMPSAQKIRAIHEFYPQFFIINRNETRENSFNEDYSAWEDIYAGYAMFRHDFNKLMILGGIRFEKTKIRYEGRAPILDRNGNYVDLDTITDSRSIDFVLPQIQLKYRYNDRINFRAAMTYTFSRPNFQDVIPYREEDRDQVKYGNPELKFPKALNIDFLVEYYMSDAGIISGGIFYKNIDNFIFYYKTYAHEDTITNSLVEINIPLNGLEASVYGAEIQFQSKLNFLPGIAKNFGLFLNYTFTQSEAKINQRKPANYTDAVIKFDGDLLPQITQEGEEAIQLPGQAKHAANFALFYDSKRFYTKISANFNDTFLYALGADKDLDEYYGSAWHLDFTANYTLTNKLNFFTDVINILNTPQRFYLGNSNEYIKKQEFYGWTTRFGIKLRF